MFPPITPFWSSINPFGNSILQQLAQITSASCENKSETNGEDIDLKSNKNEQQNFEREENRRTNSIATLRLKALEHTNKQVDLLTSPIDFLQ
jgi:hypothetical protein